MKTAGNYSPALQGALLATLACIIWSGNFIVARSAATALPPVMLALLRWACASVVMLPLSLAAFKAHWPHIKQHKGHLLLASLTGVVIFNTMVYKAGQYTT
ncbi:MAG TPA: EamA family transporter, partial [Phnomibacter sp.]|nr:EamA family transporter [Phnomibacter sp.]